MKTDNIIREKSFAFAVRIVDTYKHLLKEHNERVMSKQLIRCGTSIGANVEEAIGGQSKADFLAKLSIAYKEGRETAYWIRLLHATQYLTDETMKSLLSDIDELCKIIGSIQKTTKSNM